LISGENPKQIRRTGGVDAEDAVDEAVFEAEDVRKKIERAEPQSGR
jgi:hypothetical protein